MAGNMIANTATTYGLKGFREDLTDTIWRVSPTETPFVTNIAKGKATNVNHEWQTVALQAASTSNAYVQGDDATVFEAADSTVRLGNYTQISRKTLIVSRTAEKAMKAGRKSEIAFNLMLKGLELRRDIEKILLSNQAKVAPASATVPKTASVLSWITTNVNKASDGTNPTGDGSDARGDGTQRDIDESFLKDVLQQVFTNSSGEPDLLLVGPVNKQNISTFSGNVTRFQDTSSKEVLITAISVYSGDFGTIKVTPDRFQRSRDALVLNTDFWALCWFDPIQQKELATTGDASKRMIVGEYALEARNEQASGIIADLS